MLCHRLTMSDQSNNTDELDFIARMAMAVASRDSGSQAVGVASYARTMMDGMASSYHCGKPAHGVMR